MESLVYVASVESLKHLHCSVALYVAFVAFSGETVVIGARGVVVGCGVPEILAGGYVLFVVNDASPTVVDIEFGVGESVAFDEVLNFKNVVDSVAVGCYSVGELYEVVDDINLGFCGVVAHKHRAVVFGIGGDCYKAHYVVAHAAACELPMVFRLKFEEFLRCACRGFVAEYLP